MKIIKIESNNGELTASSLEIAKVTGKAHKHVLVDIREEIGEPNFRLANYKDKQGKERPMYILNERQTLQLMSRYSKEVRDMVFDEFYRMKEYIKSQQESKQELSTADILKLATAEIEKLETQLIETTARKNEVTSVLNTIQTYGDNILFRDFVKVVYQENKIEITEKDFRNMLKQEKYIMSNNMPYAQYKQYFNVNKGVKNGKAWTTTRLSAKGQLYFTNKLVKLFEV